MSLAFLLAGQGSQKVGMGTDLISACEDCRLTFQSADAALGFSLSSLMSSGPDEKLGLTRHAQPAILTLSVAHARHLRAQRQEPARLAGHSLGMYSALVVAGALDFSVAVRLVAERGRLMQKTVPVGKGAMMAIVGLERDTVYEACRQARKQGVVNVAGHNTVDQTVISGEVKAVEAAASFCEDEGGGAVPLGVSAPFHCELMAPMLPEFSDLIYDTPFRPPKIPVIDDVTGKPFGDVSQIRQSLIAQITSPILFEEALTYLVAEGVDHFIQCGPGKTLVNFAQRIAPHAALETFEQASLTEAIPL